MDGDRAKGGNHGWVGGDGVVQQGPDDMLDKGHGLGWQDRRFVGVIGPLDSRAIHGFLPGMEEILGERWHWKMELVEDGREVVEYGDVAVLPGVVPVKCQAALPCTSSVDGYSVQLAEGLD